MQFVTTTAAPEGVPAAKQRQNQIKDLLFEAVSLYIADNPDAYAELLAKLNGPDVTAVTS